VPVAVFADGGLYSQTAHGSATQGVQRDLSIPQGNCSQCHEGHGQNGQDFGLWTVNDNNLCFTCHASARGTYSGQTTYASSAHAGSTALYGQRPVGQCVQCHNPHGAGDAAGAFPHLAARHEEETCFTCHGSGIRPAGAKDIRTATTKRYGHDVSMFRRLHDDAAEYGSVGTSPNPRLSGSSRHVECADCHNTHASRSTPRTERSSAIGEAQLGSWGVRPLFTGVPWMAPSGYVVERFQSTATSQESHLCFKCHSSYSWGSAAPMTADGMLQTNTALEVSPGNPSYHNVTGQAEMLVPTEDFVFGSAGPPAYVNQWGPNSQMACSDCHASDASSGDARGPHGSSYPNLLKKRFRAQAGAFDNTGRAGTQADLCFECHDWNTYGEEGVGAATNFRSGGDNLHAKAGHAQAGCFQCHSAVPHGFKRKHMIVYANDGAPYYQSDPVNYATKKGGIEAWAHANGGDYTVNNCKTGCHEPHQQAQPVNPLP